MLLHLQVSVPYLRSEYGKEYDFDAPVKLLDSMMHEMADQPDQQVVVLCQVSSKSDRSLPAVMLAGDESILAQSVWQQDVIDTLGCEVLGHDANYGGVS